MDCVVRSPVERLTSTHVFSGIVVDANALPTSVNSIAYFSTVPVGKERRSVQTVAKRSVGGGFRFPGTLKFTLVSQKFGSMFACTVHLRGTNDAMNL